MMFVACKQYGGEFGGRIHNKRRILSSLGDDVRVNCSRNCEENEEDGSSHSCDVDWRVRRAGQIAQVWISTWPRLL